MTQPNSLKRYGFVGKAPEYYVKRVELPDGDYVLYSDIATRPAATDGSALADVVMELMSAGRPKAGREDAWDRALRQAEATLTTQGREAELREAQIQGACWAWMKNLVPGPYTEAWAMENATRIVDERRAALATPKPVEAPAQTGSDDVFCDNCGRAPGLASVRRCHKCAEPDHAPTPEATTELCQICGKPSGSPIHFWMGGKSAHTFTPAPKEQRT